MRSDQFEWNQRDEIEPKSAQRSHICSPDFGIVGDEQSGILIHAGDVEADYDSDEEEYVQTVDVYAISIWIKFC